MSRRVWYTVAAAIGFGVGATATENVAGSIVSAGLILCSGLYAVADSLEGYEDDEE